MANSNNPFGFRPIIRAGGAPFSINQYAKPASDANALFAFDVVIKVAVAVAMPEAPTYNLPGIQTGYQATPGTSLLVGASLAFGAASTLTVHPVVDETDVIFNAQAKTGVVITTVGHVGKNANLSLTQAGSTSTRMSKQAIDSATIAATATLDFRLRLISMASPNAEGDSAILEVSINKHFYAQGAAGV